VKLLGHVYIDALLGDPRRVKVIKKRMLVDTGATYTCISPKLADELGLTIVGESDVTLADKRKVKAGVSLAYAELGGRGDIVEVRIFETEEPILGVFTLEALGLTVDPVSGEVSPTRSFTARA